MRFQANPVVVDAFKIVFVGDVNPEPIDIGDSTYPAGFRRLLIEAHDGCGNRWQVQATAEMLARMTPVAGDYWVVQSDGYTYLNPKDVFERKYSPIAAPNPLEMTLSYGLGYTKLQLSPGDLDLSPEVFAQRFLAPAVAPLMNMADPGRFDRKLADRKREALDANGPSQGV